MSKSPTPAKLYDNETTRWSAVQARDNEADGHFFYAVRTTGVYCRPSCGSRPARRENISFYDNIAAAEHAGFRACKRCKPDQPALADQHAAKVAEACKLIETSEPVPALEQLAEAVGLSQYHFHRLFKAATGLTPKGYAKAHRSKRVQQELARRDSVTEAIYEAGYNSNGRFYADTNGMLGMTPSRFKTGGHNTEIRFAIGQCSLGAILVAATDKGVCSILLDDDPDALIADLQDRFPSATLLGGDANFECLVAQVVGFIEAPALGLNLPLDIRGTAFQQRVWQALQQIPAGSTASYAEIAARIGSPKAMRAVAQACANNPLAVAIPCHRVVRTDGGLSGYRWGVDRKRNLLERESGQHKDAA